MFASVVKRKKERGCDFVNVCMVYIYIHTGAIIDILFIYRTLQWRDNHILDIQLNVQTFQKCAYHNVNASLCLYWIAYCRLIHSVNRLFVLYVHVCLYAWRTFASFVTHTHSFFLINLVHIGNRIKSFFSSIFAHVRHVCECLVRSLMHDISMSRCFFPFADWTNERKVYVFFSFSKEVKKEIYAFSFHLFIDKLLLYA